ncbi:Hsp70 family protein [Amycolatopsis sp. CA-230715]|uniref:Hsp70 family protein n=1 Tax=Amycolatopsis sp. CA-230715 TaxID=2745196 RepID=UPI001C037EE9|nr:Hsp70 family protein [Amycolatopsis sp. CA-230715]QWF82747.1 Chaperone protein HscA [Amycolatopsis sp. CA-230715]
MGYGVGIDLGTSFTSAAAGGSGGVTVVPLSPRVVVPSVAGTAPDGSLLTGTAALARAAGPAALARGFKRRLGDPSPLPVGRARFSPPELMAAQLRDVLTEVARKQGEPPESVVLTCPAVWGPYRREHFAEVPRLAGVHDYRLVTEPEAAATHYSRERRLGDGETVAVYDLGGGTFDTTILRIRPGGMEILGTPEGIEHLGGIDFDDVLFTNLDERLGGAISALDPADPASAAALSAIRALCTKTKETLSVEPEARLSVPLPSGAREISVSRTDFNAMIEPSVRSTIDALRRTVTSAGLKIDDLAAILLTGGSSRIPLVTEMVFGEFGKPVRVTLHPKFTVALGAAAIAATRPAAPAKAPAPVAPSSSAPPVEQDTVALPFVRPLPPLASDESYIAEPPRKKWLVPVITASVLVVIAAVTTLLFLLPSGTHKPGAGAPGPSTSSLPLVRGDANESGIGFGG